LYQLHDVEFADNIDEVINGALQVCLELKKQGKIGAIGINGYPLGVLKEGIIKANGRINTHLMEWAFLLIMVHRCGIQPMYCKLNGDELGKLAANHTLNVPGDGGTVLMGMEKMVLLNTNMSALFDGLSQKENEIYQKIMKE
jgi:hypothetical protein